MTKILIVEDEIGLVTLLKYNLEKQGYETVSVMDGKEVMPTALVERPDLILLDWMLPGITGIDLAREIRKSHELKNTPVIMLTARGEEADKVRGLSVGADDYMTKPFSVPELMARIVALLRRVPAMPPKKNITFQDLTMDFTQRRVTRNGKNIHLGPTEFRLLQVFMEKPGEVFSREALLKAVWGASIHVELRTVDVHIRRLRRALNAGGMADIIRTVRSAGYALESVSGK
ncbi:MAG: phosphate regulon transcriptional regulator PhoB [Lactobacillales bacterium]|jgi:two-component system phosphate regulon response regulator PhoB|nr:phosphate regulon transcriptional regulator PhoB [Lactobacillales bacterium]